MSAEPVIGVLAGCGGAGASTFAAVLAGCAGPPAFLLDCDPLGGGIDVLLGCEQLPGPRWGQVRLRGGPLDPQVLLSGLPCWHEVRFLAADSQQQLTELALATVIDHYLAAPLVQGMMLQEARPTRADKALLVDGGSGYMAELLRPLTGSLEVLSPLDAVAPSRKRGDFTLLVIDGAIEQLPDALVQRLAEGSRVVTGLVRNGLTRLAVGRKAAGEVSLLALAEIGIPALPEFAAKKQWSF